MSDLTKTRQDGLIRPSAEAIAQAFFEAKLLSAERAPQYQVAYNYIIDRARELDAGRKSQEPVATVVGKDSWGRIAVVWHRRDIEPETKLYTGTQAAEVGEEMVDEALFCTPLSPDGDEMAMPIDLMGMGMPEHIDKARCIMRAALLAAFAYKRK